MLQGDVRVLHCGVMVLLFDFTVLHYGVTVLTLMSQCSTVISNYSKLMS